jgi:beta-phosphoglucomutase family hydrolase
MTQTPPIQAFIFDMDGTLVDNMPFHMDAWVQLMAEQGIPIERDEFLRQTAGNTNAMILRRFINEALTDAEVDNLGEYKEELYRAVYRGNVNPLNGLHAFLLEARRQGIKLGVATSATPENIDFVLSEIGLREDFDAIVGAVDITHGKPDPEIFLVSAERLGVAPEACLVFEDAPAGIEAARRAGMRAAVVLTSLDVSELADAPHVMASAPDFVHFKVDELIQQAANFVP